MKKPTLIISACLYGYPVRYDGQAVPLPAAILKTMSQQYELIPVCPECLGGLATPRPAAEILDGDGEDVLSGRACVKDIKGDDISTAFITGARQVLETAKANNAHLAVLKSNSPSCGSSNIYDGTFCGKLRKGPGVTTALLRKNGILVVSDDNVHLEYDEKSSATIGINGE
jgi:uncharacterized protein YbbK (DUF523 family)